MSKAMLAKATLSTVLGLFFVNVGIAHFTDTEWFEPIVPEVLQRPYILGLDNWSDGNSNWFRIDYP